MLKFLLLDLSFEYLRSIHGSVDHPCILRRFDVYHEKSDLFVEMEYAAGGSLYDRIHKTYIMDEDECKFVFYQIGCALAYLHRLKIVSRDRSFFLIDYDCA